MCQFIHEIEKQFKIQLERAGENDSLVDKIPQCINPNIPKIL